MSKLLATDKREASRRAVVEYLVRSQRFVELHCKVHGTYVKHPNTDIENRVCPMCLTTGRIS